ncbi:MAG: hypothetical protein ACREX9_08435 [Gammaproteobacteria bacterium]
MLRYGTVRVKLLVPESMDFLNGALGVEEGKVKSTYRFLFRKRL